MGRLPLFFSSYLFYTLLLFCTAVTAQPAVVGVGEGVWALGRHLQLLEDPGGRLGIDEVVSEARQGRFEQVGDETTNLGFTRSAWWVRFAVTNESTSLRTLMLRQAYPLIDRLRLYRPDGNGGWTVSETGDRLPFHRREVANEAFIFPLTLEPGETKEYFLRFSSAGPVNIDLAILTPGALADIVGNERLWKGVYYGGMIALILYNLFLFGVLRDRSYLNYLLYIISYTLFLTTYNGITFQYFWPNSPEWGNYGILVFLCFSVFWMLQFSRHFLDADRTLPRLSRAGLVIEVLFVAGLAASVILPYFLISRVIVLMTLVSTILILIMGGLSLWRGYRPARYFMFAWTAMLAGLLITALKTFGLVPHTFITLYGIQIGSFLEVVLLSLALADRMDDLRRQSLTDPLTGLANRRCFDDLFKAEFDRAFRYGTPLSVALLDLDHFKRINDQHGHGVGDQVLQKAADVLRATSRKHDMVSRYGGEEFVFILPNTSPEAARHVFERIRERVQGSTVRGLSVTISIGFANYPASRFDSAASMLRAADIALYEAKGRGRNQVVCYCEDIDKPGRGAPLCSPANSLGVLRADGDTGTVSTK